ncbi:hypothetical protein G0Q06_03965 [Puniceicoccales bacterium CK1056]|uniref:Uncharacterized protein n=1 Tax=Oceanipulchritudo coccoides TaxID=2706888 RepID=A0A6B2LY95_9BACT|nr:hypothetical protein [Oceanipulchritudo coccoides]NDV61598.1 hypothetical protein [Oceanipulchritudo coccoides]
MLKALQLSLFGILALAASSAAQLAPSEGTVAASLPGQSIGGTQFLSATRFDWFGEPGNWSYTRLSQNVGLLTQTYDDGGNNPASYREETELTFLTEISGTYAYREYVGGGLDFSTSGEFDFPWLTGTKGTERWWPVGWVYVSWPYISAGSWPYIEPGSWPYNIGRWYRLDTSGASVQWRVNVDTGLRQTFAANNEWHRFTWPYSFSAAESAWYWYDPASTQWVVDLQNGIWSRLGK